MRTRRWVIRESGGYFAISVAEAYEFHDLLELVYSDFDHAFQQDDVVEFFEFDFWRLFDGIEEIVKFFVVDL